MTATGRKAAFCAKVDSPATHRPLTDAQWARAFIDRGRGLHGGIAQSALTAMDIGCLETGHEWLNQCYLDCFKYN